MKSGKKEKENRTQNTTVRSLKPMQLGRRWERRRWLFTLRWMFVSEERCCYARYRGDTEEQQQHGHRRAAEAPPSAQSGRVLTDGRHKLKWAVKTVHVTSRLPADVASRPGCGASGWTSVNQSWRRRAWGSCHYTGGGVLGRRRQAARSSRFWSRFHAQYCWILSIAFSLLESYEQLCVGSTTVGVLSKPTPVMLEMLFFFFFFLDWREQESLQTSGFSRDNACKHELIRTPKQKRRFGSF